MAEVLRGRTWWWSLDFFFVRNAQGCATFFSTEHFSILVKTRTCVCLCANVRRRVSDRREWSAAIGAFLSSSQGAGVRSSAAERESSAAERRAYCTFFVSSIFIAPTDSVVATSGRTCHFFPPYLFCRIVNFLRCKMDAVLLDVSARYSLFSAVPVLTTLYLCCTKKMHRTQNHCLK